MLDQIDPIAEIERLIESRTCEVCGDVWSEALSRYWKCRNEQRNGYVLKHWRYWRLCPNCLTKLTYNVGGFEKFIFPVIANMAEVDVVEQLVQVQPMNVPAAAVMYLDYQIGPEGVRRRERRGGNWVREDYVVQGRVRNARVV